MSSARATEATGHAFICTSRIAHEDDMVERSTGVLDSVVGCAGVGGEGLAATRAAVTPSLPSFGLEEAVADDVPPQSCRDLDSIYRGILEL